MVAVTQWAKRTPWSMALAALAVAAGIRAERGGRHACHCPADPAGARVMLEVEYDGPAPARAVAAVLDDGLADRVAPLFTRDDAELRRWVLVETHDAETALAALRAQPGVRHAEIAPQVADAAIDPGAAAFAPLDDGPSCPLKTPSYAESQEYAGPAPAGIDAPAAWALPGGRGEGVWLADIESAWNPAHEDLPGDRIEKVTRGRGSDHSEHGTAVLGELVGVDNGLGVTGLAPAIERIYTASYLDAPLAGAIDRAAAKLRQGDVMLLEVQGTGPRNRYVPVEYWSSVFAVIQRATARGVIVVEAAGNGSEDLDHPAYKGAFDRRRRDSGAILVGAGAPPRPGFVARARLDFSNYGARVDVQGWGRRVTTLDYGDLQRCSSARDGRPRDYTGAFAGTSSASPIVAGAAVQLAGVYRARHGAPISPQLVRDLLTQTGTPQVAGPGAPLAQHIGPLPDLRAALAALDGY
ncbi:MAG: S8 family serine peptidase [Deltaproteobacteria bacterium]|nr:S8 family serine peptidase [Deltaproteobacteria bacterium]